VSALKGQIDEFLQNPQEILRVAIGIAAFTYSDESKMSALLAKSNSEVIAGLSTVIGEPEKPGLKKQVELISKEILPTLASKANITDHTLREKIKALKEAHQIYQAAHGEEEKKAKKRPYQAALIGLIDHLYANAHIPEEDIKRWTVHLVPPFLEQFRGELFHIIGENMTSLKDAFKPDGKFNDNSWGMWAALKAIKTAPETVVDPRINGLVDALPLTPARKEALRIAAVSLRPVILQPFLSATFEAGAYRNKVEKIITKSELPKVEGDKWKTYIDAYAAFFNQIAQQLTGDQPTSKQ
jgi:hypothetical protein